MLHAIFILKTQNGNILLGKDVDCIKLGRKQRSGSVFSERLIENLIHFGNHLLSLLFLGKSNLGQKGTVVVFDKIQIYVLQLIVVLIKSTW